MTDGQSEMCAAQDANTLPKHPHEGTTGNDRQLVETALIAIKIRANAEELRVAATNAIQCERETNMYMAYSLRATRHQAVIVQLVGELLDLDPCPQVDAEGISGEMGVEDTLQEGGQ